MGSKEAEKGREGPPTPAQIEAVGTEPVGRSGRENGGDPRPAQRADEKLEEVLKAGVRAGCALEVHGVCPALGP